MLMSQLWSTLFWNELINKKMIIQNLDDMTKNIARIIRVCGRKGVGSIGDVILQGKGKNIS